MKVFISWSGERSRTLAETLRKWLPGMLQAVRPYFTPDDLTKGTRWNSEVSRELEACRIGIICLTAENLQAPWLMFEAGALSKSLEGSRVCPLLFGVEPTDIKGPLVQFQAARFRHDEFKDVVQMINAELGDAALEAGVFDEAFEMWWPKLEGSVLLQLSQAIPGKESPRSDRDLLEEILTLTRSFVRAPEVPFVESLIIEALVQHYLRVIREAGRLESSVRILEELYTLQNPIRQIVRKLVPDNKAVKLLNQLDVARKALHEFGLTVDSEVTRAQNPAAQADV